MNIGRRLISTSLSSLVFALLPISSFALGLGEIRLHSYLNEPLDAEIALLDVKDLDLNNLKVNIADTNAFMKAGLEAPGWLSSIQFEVIPKTASGAPSIRLTTEQPIKDPFLDLLVVAAWPDGKLVKAYTLLLDPPKISADAGRRIPLHPNASKIRFGGQYRLGYHEALWNIAKQLVANTPLSIYQGMMAIAQKNPQAFKGNIHEMRQGVILQLPIEAEIQRHSVEEAQQFVELQNPEHKAHSGTRATTPHSATAVSATTAPSAATSPPTTSASATMSVSTTTADKPLKIVAPATQLPPMSATVIGSEKSNSALTGEMTQRLSLIEEAIDTLKRTNEDISRKNQELQQQNETLNALLAQKNEEINRLKNETPQPPPLSTLVPLDLPAMPKISPQKTPQKVSHPQPVVPKSTLWSISNFLMMVILVAAALAALWWMKRKPFVNMIRSKMATTSKKKLVLTAAATENIPDAQIEFNLDKALEAVTQEEKKYSKPSVVTQVPEKEDLDNGKKTTASLDDAEIFIAYERYAQAEKVLQQVLAHQPDHWKALLKLLELYVLTEKYQEFEKLFATIPKDLKALSPDTWSKIELLLEKVQSEKIVPIANTNLQAAAQQKASSQSSASISSPKKLSDMVPKFTLEKIEEETPKPKDDVSPDNPKDSS